VGTTWSTTAKVRSGRRTRRQAGRHPLHGGSELLLVHEDARRGLLHELEELLERLRAAYQARLNRKFEADEVRMERLRQLAVGHSALGILRALRELDDEEK